MGVIILLDKLLCTTFHLHYSDCVLGNETLTDEEERIIRDAVEEFDTSEPPSSQYYSSEDPYIHITTGDISEELQLVKDRKCISFFTSLKELLGNMCRVEGCSKKIENTQFGDGCGYGCKLTWFCEDNHKYVLL